MSSFGDSMIMGSPLSPSSPGAHGVQSPYLPSYLMGDPAPSSQPIKSSTRLFSGQSSSPPKNTSFSKNATFSSPFTSNNAQAPRSEPRRDVMSSRPKDKPGAPPTTGLLETMMSPATAAQTPTEKWGDHSLNVTGRLGQITSPYGGQNTPGNSIFSPDTSHMYSQPQKTPPSPAQIDPFYTQGESIRPDDELDETWVTIFGFPPAATSFILQQFSQYGNIQKHIVTTEGNWMHVHFQSLLQAKKALSKNGKVFGGTIMVGVTPCINKNVMDMSMAGGGPSDSLHRTGFHTPAQRMNQSICDRSLNASTMQNTSIRPLTAAYKAANCDHEVAPGHNTPQKSNGIVQQAMEYVFGW